MLEALQSSRFLFILPDKGQKTSQKPYRQLADFASNFGVEVYMIDIRWKKHNSLLECALEATKKVHEIVDELHPTHCYFFGFGIGAMIAAQVGYLFRSQGMLLCSMPPYFHEELPLLGSFRKYWAIKKIYGAKNNPAYPAKKVKVKTVFIYSEKEKKSLQKILPLRSEAFPKNSTVFTAKVSPSLKRKKYFETLKAEMEKLLKES